MDCQKASVLMMEFLDGTISETDRFSLREHFEKCEYCSQEFSLLLEGISLIDNIPQIEPPLELEDFVMGNIDIYKYRKPSRTIKWLFRIATMVSFIFGILVYLAFNDLIILEQTIVPALIKIVNFTVLTLPSILVVLEENLILIIGLGICAFSILLSSILMLVITEYYIVEELDFNFKGGVKS